MTDHRPDPARYQRLPYRRCGRSGLVLPALSLGTWHTFGASTPADVQRDVLLRAFDLGITHVDLANVYGPPPGWAEEVVGRVVRRELAGHRDELVVSTKAGYRAWPGPYGEWGSRKSLVASLDASLCRLGLDYVDVFYLHRPDPDTPWQETTAALADLVRAGKALHVGVSNCSAEQIRSAAQLLAEQGVPMLITQPAYSMFARHVEHEGILDEVARLGIGCAVFSPLAQGLLTDRYLGGVPDGSRADRGEFLRRSDVDDVYLTRARALNRIAADRGQSLAQLALTWVLRRPEVTTAIIGASSVAQLEHNVAALSGSPLAAAELAEIDRYAVDGTGRS